MVRELFSKSSEISFGSVSLSADELLAIIEEKHFQKVTATNNGMAFDSWEDMKKNKALLAGNPKIDCGEIKVTFERFSPSISIYKFSNENLGIAKSIAAEISHRLR
jgi:hypothetical protein